MVNFVYQTISIMVSFGAMIIMVLNTILGVAILVIQRDYTFLESLVYAIASAIGFGLALVIFAGLREHLAMADIPKSMRGVAITLVTAGILALAFMGFSGVDGGLKPIFGIE